MCLGGGSSSSEPKGSGAGGQTRSSESYYQEIKPPKVALPSLRMASSKAVKRKTMFRDMKLGGE